MKSIWERRGEVERDRRKKMTEVMRDYDEQVYRPAMKALREEYATSDEGHSWRFTDVGPLGDPWFHCNKCGTSEVRRNT
jgi:hypothetical protein